MDALEAIMKRKSVRSYRDEQVPDGDLEKVIEAGKSGPGGGAIHISVIQRRDLLRRINDIAKQAMLSSGSEFAVKRASLPGYEPLYGAPTLIILSAPDPNGAASASCAAENMLIAATALGLGSCYLMSPRGAFSGEHGAELMRECGIPEGYAVCCAVILGYQAGEAFASPVPKVRTVNYVR